MISNKTKWIPLLITFLLLQLYIAVSIASLWLLKFVNGLAFYYVTIFPFLFWAVVIVFFIKNIKRKSKNREYLQDTSSGEYKK